MYSYGIDTGDISLYYNPRNEPHATSEEKAVTLNDKATTPNDPKSTWRRWTIAQLNTPVAMTLADVAGNGRMDIIICYHYGKTALTADPKGGYVVWLENPGKNAMAEGKPWTERYIGSWPAMYRLRAGYFTNSSVLQVVAAPLSAALNDFATPVPLLLFTRPDKIYDAVEWPREIIDDQNFLSIHEAAHVKFNSKSQEGRDSFVLASKEGITWMHYDKTPSPQWKATTIGIGVPLMEGQHYGGEGSVNVGTLPGDDVAYFLSVGPFDGGYVSAYTKKGTGPTSTEWEHHLLDVYGTPEQQYMQGGGPGHHVAVGDFDGDGVDECLVAMFGPSAQYGQGVYYYKPVDLANGIFAKWKVANESAARIAVGDFTGDGRLDFATIVYNVPGYYEGSDPAIHLYCNQFARLPPTDPQVISTLWENEPLIYFPKPETIKKTQEIPLLEIGGYRVHLVIMPPNNALPVLETQGIKVLWGQLSDCGVASRALSVPPFEAESARVESSLLNTNAEGCVFIRFVSITNDIERRKWKTNADVPVETLWKPSYEQLQVPTKNFLKFKQYDTDDTRPKRDFYNLTGFNFRFLEDKVNLCHMQFWTAAKDTNCGVHNHTGDVFLEVHISLFPGTGNGGMWRVTDGVYVDPNDPNAVPPESFDKLPLGKLEQHGGFWDRNCVGTPMRRENSKSINYPWHKWQGGDEGDALDIWTAFEFNPDLITSLE